MTNRAPKAGDWAYLTLSYDHLTSPVRKRAMFVTVIDLQSRKWILPDGTKLLPTDPRIVNVEYVDPPSKPSSTGPHLHFAASPTAPKFSLSDILDTAKVLKDVFAAATPDKPTTSVNDIWREAVDTVTSLLTPPPPPEPKFPEPTHKDAIVRLSDGTHRMRTASGLWLNSGGVASSWDKIKLDVIEVLAT
jgi:hypothetical protein